MYGLVIERFALSISSVFYFNPLQRTSGPKREEGILDVNFYDYGSLMGTTFGMDKKQRIQTFASGSSHAMTLMAVDLDANGKPKKWMVENSWGPGANAGHLIMTDQWFNEYMFRLVVNKKYITDQAMEYG